MGEEDDYAEPARTSRMPSLAALAIAGAVLVGLCVLSWGAFLVYFFPTR